MFPGGRLFRRWKIENTLEILLNLLYTFFGRSLQRYSFFQFCLIFLFVGLLQIVQTLEVAKSCCVYQLQPIWQVARLLSFYNSCFRLRVQKRIVNYNLKKIFQSVKEIQYPASSIKKPVSSIKHPVSPIKKPVSSIQHPPSRNQYPVSSIRHPASAIKDS